MSSVYDRTMGYLLYRLRRKYLNLIVTNHCIDFEEIESIITKYDLDRTTMLMEEAYKTLPINEIKRIDFFGSMKTYGGRNISFRRNPFFMFPPNIAAMDFILKNVPRESIIVDYGCGLGNLLIYLYQMGYQNVHGYDDFSQIREDIIAKYLETFGLAQILKSKEGILQTNSNVAMIIGHYWDNLCQDIIAKELSNNGLKYILSDHVYEPKRIENYKRRGIYKNCITIYERI